MDIFKRYLIISLLVAGAAIATHWGLKPLADYLDGQVSIYETPAVADLPLSFSSI